MSNKDICFKTQSIGLEGAINTRELGGYILPCGKKIKRGLLIRGANLNKLSAKDKDILINQYRLRAIIDFRMDSEVFSSPDMEIPGARYYRLPAMDRKMCEEYDGYYVKGGFKGTEDVVIRGASTPEVQKAAATMYASMVESEYTQGQYAEFFKILLAREDGAVYWHCTQGKDRTGLASAFLLAALGAERDLIMADYDISNEFYKEELLKIEKLIISCGGTDRELSVAKTFVGANAELFSESLDGLEKEYGSLIGFLHSRLSLSESDIQTLRSRYLE